MRPSPIILLVLGALTGRAAGDRLEASLTAGTWLAPSVSMDAVTTARGHAMAMVGLGVALRVADLAFTDGLWAELRWDHGSTAARDFQLFDVSLGLDAVQAGVRTARHVTSWLGVFAAAHAGVTVGELGLALAQAPSALHDRDLVLSARAGLGLEATLLGGRSSRMELAVRVEAAWLFTGGLTFAASPSLPDDDTARLATRAAGLGSIDPGGPSFGIALVGRF